ncbi:MAG: hypothetical protein IAG10_19160 [Planctomycetaceae bacterium]|nr:hypothetical protein [Planctomycetaceae bacterium]
MADMVASEGCPRTAAEWAVYRAAQIGFIVVVEWSNEAAWCQTTRSLMEWWQQGCPLEFVKERLTGGSKNATRRRTTRKGKGGRPKVDGEKEQQDFKLFDRWQTAKEAKTAAKDFCDDEGITIGELDRIVDWVATRRRRGQL